jgi:hypothetical protein
MMRSQAMLLTLITLSSGLPCAAQDVNPTEVSTEFQENEISLSEWKARVNEAKIRAEAFIQQAREGKSLRSDNHSNDSVSDERVLGDPSLQRGDIVTTSKGVFVFIGKGDEANRAASFVPLNATGSISGQGR